jgi:hypothetical protein
MIPILIPDVDMRYMNKFPASQECIGMASSWVTLAKRQRSTQIQVGHTPNARAVYGNDKRSMASAVCPPSNQSSTDLRYPFSWNAPRSSGDCQERGAGLVLFLPLGG